jgi:hypothetical protein
MSPKAGKDETTSLWAVIEGMQLRLEALGLESEVVDAAVTRGLEALLERDTSPPRPVRRRAAARGSLFSFFMGRPAQA